MSKKTEEKKGLVEVVSPIVQSLNLLNLGEMGVRISDPASKGGFVALKNQSRLLAGLGRDFISGASVVEVAEPLKIIIDKEQSQLKRIINEYYKYDADSTVDDLERDKHRQRLAARLCRYLSSLEPIKDHINGYATLRQFFCQGPAAS